jgi:hypothetical protein
MLGISESESPCSPSRHCSRALRLAPKRLFSVVVFDSRASSSVPSATRSTVVVVVFSSFWRNWKKLAPNV